MRHLVLALGFASLGCGSLLGLDDFSDAPPTSSSTSAGGSGASGGSGAVGGGGGDGGMAGSGATGGDGGTGGMMPTISCQTQGVAFDIFTAADLGMQEIDDRFHLVPDDDESRVHVIVVLNEGTHDVFARTVDGSDLSPIVTWTPPMNMGSPRLEAGRVGPPASLRFLGTVGNEIGVLQFGLDNGSTLIPNPAPFFAPLPSQPAGCNSPGFVRNLRVAYNMGNPSLAVTCESAAARTLFVGDASGFSQVDQGGPMDPAVDVRNYAATPTKLLLTGDDFGGVSLMRFGMTAADLAPTHPFSVSNDPMSITGGASLVPAPMGADGVTIISARLGKPPASLVPADMYTGVMAAADYAAHLSQVPPPELTIKQSIDDLNDMPLMERLTFNADFILGAGTNVGLNRVLFNYFRRDGTLEVFGQEVYVAPANVELTRAFAAPSGAVNILVAWSEKSGAVWSIRGQRLFCG